ncbi:MAG: DUF2190 family protein [Phycisphaerales bacterium]|nr:DUF2190 family protein [Phycisphaerales bacterium]
MTVIATAVLTQFRGVNIAGALPGAGLTTFGIAQQGAAIGDATPVVVLGTAIAEAGAAIAVGALLEVNAAGQVITRAAGVIIGRALTAAAALGDQVEVFLIPN